MSSFDDGEYYMVLTYQAIQVFAPIKYHTTHCRNFKIEENKIYFLMNKGRLHNEWSFI